MQIHSAVFQTSAPDYEGCPESDHPEFAFIGRSNVGKSSLINMLMKQKDLAVVSSKPGRTRLINFFNINKNWTLVDLPGYGYAKASGQTRHKFNEFVSDYLAQRPNLSCVFLLIDSRIPPQQKDLEFSAWLIEYEIPFVLVFTKADKVKPSLVEKHVKSFQSEMDTFCSVLPRVYICSAKTGAGRREILEFIDLALKNY